MPNSDPQGPDNQFTGPTQEIGPQVEAFDKTTPPTSPPGGYDKEEVR